MLAYQDFLTYLASTGVRGPEEIKEKSYEAILSGYSEARNSYAAGLEEFRRCSEAIAQNTGVSLPAVQLSCYANFGWELQKEYEVRKIPSKIYWDTMSDLGIWSEHCRRKTGALGLLNIGWLNLHMRLRLFRIGRLQFETAVFEAEEGRNQLADGVQVLQVHIAEGQPLDHAACLESYRMAPLFFEEHPEFHFTPKAFLCYSWLLHPNLREVLPPTANIIRFQSDYQIIYQDDDNTQTLERVFDIDKKNDSTPVFPQNTSLQKKVKAYLDQGGVLGSGEGLILLPGAF